MKLLYFHFGLSTMWFVVVKFVLLIVLTCSHRVVGTTCSPKWFDCGNGKCIAEMWLCDGDNDCGNLNDERECVFKNPPAQNVCSSSRFQCKSEDYYCIPEKWHCDGDDDCIDGSDEIECSTTCPPRWFDCGNGKCIAEIWHCDGENDCGNFNDEKECDVSKEICTGFTCRNRKCIPDIWRCDGNKDCDDGSDEELCPQSKLCNDSEFLCSSGSCILQQLVCNGKKDCGDGSDEGPHCGDLCENATCSQNCKITPMGPQCYCNDGYALDSKDNKTCNDVNECQQVGFCSHDCTNTKGGYTCSCQDGYELVNRTCLATGAEPLLIYSTGKEVRGISLRSNEYFPVASAVVYITAVDVDPKRQRVYWIDISNKSTIYTAKIDGSGLRSVLSHGLLLPEDIAVDYITNNLYVTDSGLRQVLACKADGRMCHVLHDNSEKPRSIALDPDSRLMYWSDWGEHSSGIYRSGMDGYHRISIVSSRMGWPNGIALDHTTSRLYWVDAKLHTVEYITLDGTHISELLNTTVYHPYSLAIFEDSLYWSDWGSFSLESCDKFTGHKVTVVARQSNHTIMGVHVYHPVLTSKASNPCWSNDCSHMCLMSPVKEYSCACPHGFVLSNDQKTCITPVANCSSDEFNCLDGSCVRMLWRCDGENDCPDGSDEMNCDVTRCNEDTQMRCGNGQCVPLSWTCDGTEDCFDGSDERICSKLRSCNLGQFQCKSNGVCIDHALKCDGRADCIDSSDENYCLTIECDANDFRCVSGQCLPIEKRCDRTEDCADGSDEVGCTCDGFFCSATSLCLPWSQVCDGKEDCSFMSDEGGLCSASCADGKINCSDICQKTPQGPKCFCNNGFRLLDDNETCVDVNECHEFGTCSQVCSNRKGSYKCSCVDGYKLKDDNRSCAAEGESPTLMYILDDVIRGIDLETHLSKFHFTEKGAIMRGFDYDIAEKVFFWTDLNSESINSYSVRNNSHDVIHRSRSRPVAVRYDWVAKNLYFLDEKSNIGVCTRNGKICKTLTKSGARLINSMAISPPFGYMFWTIWSSSFQRNRSGVIRRAEMDGSHVVNIVSSEILSPTVITVDPVLKLVYWADMKLKTMECANFNGFKRRQIVKSGVHYPISTVVFEDYVYWSEWDTGSIMRCHKFIKGRCENVINENVKAYDILVTHKVMQPGRNLSHCLAENGGCSHLCLTARKRRTCACSDSMTLDVDRRTCLASKCSKNKFRCNDGLCIAEDLKCDGRQQCNDGSDEMNCSKHL